MKNYRRFREGSASFSDSLVALKASQDVDFQWYPYGTMGNVDHLAPLVDEDHDWLFSPGLKCADFGAADGDLSFYLESQGQMSDIYDFGPTNMNGLRGARRLKEVLSSKVELFEVDLDRYWNASGTYDLVYFLGLLYHLKNPFYVLESLSRVSKYMFVSTRIARFFRSDSFDACDIPAAYLLGPTESNNDATNFWIFTEAGLNRIVDRAGWDVVASHTLGDQVKSNPQDNDHDQRAFLLLRSRAI
jgi:tRNA (mo5U34)-methyltransferase